MYSALQFEHNGFDPELFFSSYWRKHPVLVRGGAGAFAGRRWSVDDFDMWLTAARAGGAAVMERAGEVTFIENVSAVDQDLADQAAGFGRMFGAPSVWFDSIRTYASSSGSGIGAHFDHSDNFVLQQSGVKHWSLAAPGHIPHQDIVHRMMNVPGVGGHALPEDEDEFLRCVLEPGDLLYIPLFWLHSGTSRADSLSVSVVCPAVSLHTAVMPFLAGALKARALGFQPIPAFHAHLPTEERRVAVAALRTATRVLLDRLTDDDLLDVVHASQTDRFPGMVDIVDTTDMVGVTPSPATTAQRSVQSDQATANVACSAESATASSTRPSTG